MKLSEHISLAEFCASQTAARRGIDNSLPESLTEAAQATAAMLERIREFLSRRAGREIPLIITSGYRSNVLNRAIGSSDSSDHVRALAVDFRAPAFGTAIEVCRALAPQVDTLDIGQLINEYPAPAGRPDTGWIHVSTRRPVKVVNRIITITAAGTVAGVVPA